MPVIHPATEVICLLSGGLTRRRKIFDAPISVLGEGDQLASFLV